MQAAGAGVLGDAGGDGLRMALRRFVISGCFGGGRSSLISELKQRGQYVVPQAGRIIVREQIALGGTALPWNDKLAFAMQLASKALEQYGSVSECNGDMFFDRSIVEVEVFCDLHDLRLPQSYWSTVDTCRYTYPIFLVPPWQEIFESDSERQHGFEAAIQECNALQLKFLANGYRVRVIPQITIAKRVDWILNAIRNET